MFILNMKDNKRDSLFKCGLFVHSYLNGRVPVLFRDGDDYYYAKTDKLNEVLDRANFLVKAVISCRQ
jgi:hypothetical protein